jgi:SAM-dependent methyltransferase
MMNCRSCGDNTEMIFSLGKTPLANELLTSRDEAFEKHPLDIMYCASCALGQIRNYVLPEKMFVEYLYFSTVCKSVVDSAKVLVERTVKTLPTDALVIELASNDGYLLQFYKDHGFTVLGVDPALGPAEVAVKKGIPTIPEFFTHDLALTLPKADVIHANNVLAHVPDINDFVAGIAEILKPEGICMIEVPYLGDLLNKGTFDTIYHEHCYYFSFKSLDRLFSRHGLYIANVEQLPSQGGSLRVTCKKEYPDLVGIASTTFPFVEYGLENVHTLQQYADQVAYDLKNTLLRFKSQGKRIWGFGAAAKATVMMNYCGIDHTLIDAVADDAPAKIGKFIPGTQIEVRSPQDWLDAQPESTCIFSWNYATEIFKRYAETYQGDYFTPYPERIKCLPSTQE